MRTCCWPLTGGELEGKYAALSVASGYYGDVSLTHRWDETVRASAIGRMRRAGKMFGPRKSWKFPWSQKAGGPAARSTGFFPSRKTLAAMPPETLRAFAQRFGHPDPGTAHLTQSI